MFANLAERIQQDGSNLSQCATSVADPILIFWGQFSEGPIEAIRLEDRVIAKTIDPTGLRDNRALADSFRESL